ncbi:uncharacterized protein LOC128217265 isoform X2 [Mya arenaria]|uniref:uncharacterized protein LOC128217265 isoform X2 n=1 Tax=Mya arenaria TaxID=6604 RepID=UPI0022E6FFD4|nr:uncharacterized protein LOC128217265 isoform X2 [Mya arenaria]
MGNFQSLCSILKDKCNTCLFESRKFYCNKFQYCCGDKCCEDIEDLYKQWFFWPIIVLILALVLAAIIWWCRRNHRSAQTQKYRQLTEETAKSLPRS